MSMRIAGEPATIVAAVERFLSRLGEVEQRGQFAATYTIDHPDGLRVRVKTKLYIDDRSLILETLRRSGDGVLYVHVVRALTDFMRNFERGFPDLVYEFYRGEIMPCPQRIPAPSPCTVPHLALEEVSPFADWHMGDLNSFCADHADVSVLIKKGEIGKKEFRAHLGRIPKSVLVDRHLSAGLPPSATACERIDDLIAHALAFWAAEP